jgi:hypothetical protein
MARYILATYPKFAGRTRLVIVGHCTHYVDYVPFGTPGAHIMYRKLTKAYRPNSRPYVTKSSAYGSLQAAVKALVESN